MKFFENLCKEIASNNKSNFTKFDINSNIDSYNTEDNQIINTNQLQQILSEINNNRSKVLFFFLVKNGHLTNLFFKKIAMKD